MRPPRRKVRNCTKSRIQTPRSGLVEIGSRPKARKIKSENNKSTTRIAGRLCDLPCQGALGFCYSLRPRLRSNLARCRSNTFRLDRPVRLLTSPVGLKSQVLFSSTGSWLISAVSSSKCRTIKRDRLWLVVLANRRVELMWTHPGVCMPQSRPCK